MERSQPQHMVVVHCKEEKKLQIYNTETYLLVYKKKNIVDPLNRGHLWSYSL